MNKPIARGWIFLGTISFLVSGILSILITSAKMPALKEILDIEFIRWCLVVHVNLATLVWFTALPMGLVYLFTYTKGNLLYKISWGAFLISCIGTLLLFSVPPHGEAEPILSNYIPILTHSRYSWGLVLYFLGVCLAICVPKVFDKDLESQKAWAGTYEIRFGLMMGSLYLILATVIFGYSFYNLSKVPLVSPLKFFEQGMWGGGHLIQHAAAVFVVCCWVLFLSKDSNRDLLSREKLFPFFVWLGAPLLITPIFLFFEPAGEGFRKGFTMLMQWGIAPPILAFLIYLFKNKILKNVSWKNYETLAFAMSALLLVVGFIFGASIRGPDLRIPGHYHASIGAVTLAFMALSYKTFSKENSRWMVLSVWIYGLGQLAFSGGMFTAGAFGMPRKTYGVENAITHWGQGVGVGMMAIGGMIALLGGLLYTVAIVPKLSGVFKKS